MAKHSGKLTKRTVTAWKGQPRTGSKGMDAILWDGQMPRFAVKVNGNGSKSFFINYRNKYNTERRYTIGKLSDSLTTEEARSEAKTLLNKIDLNGFDPLGAEKADRSAIKMGELFDQYLDSAKFASKAESTQYMDKSRIKRHLRPLLEKERVEQVKADKIRRTFADIRDGKTAVTEKTGKRGKARVTGGENAARSCIKLLSAIYNWAIADGIAHDNPCNGVEVGQTKNRKTILATTDQYKALFEALTTLENEREIPAAAADAIRVLAFTGARRNEITEARWSWVNLTEGTITVPAKSHKTGHKSGEDKVIPLPSAARAVIEARQKGKPDDYVFPGTRGNCGITLPSKLWKTIRAKANLPDGITNHALRHSIGSTMALQGAEAAQIMAALGHNQMSTTQRYIHFAQDARAALMEKYTADIAAAVAPKAEVVPRKKEGAEMKITLDLEPVVSQQENAEADFSQRQSFYRDKLLAIADQIDAGELVDGWERELAVEALRHVAEIMPTSDRPKPNRRPSKVPGDAAMLIALRVAKGRRRADAVEEMAEIWGIYDLSAIDKALARQGYKDCLKFARDLISKEE